MDFPNLEELKKLAIKMKGEPVMITNPPEMLALIEKIETLKGFADEAKKIIETMREELITELMKDELTFFTLSSGEPENKVIDLCDDFRGSDTWRKVFGVK